MARFFHLLESICEDELGQLTGHEQDGGFPQAEVVSGQTQSRLHQVLGAEWRHEVFAAIVVLKNREAGVKLVKS